MVLINGFIVFDFCCNCSPLLFLEFAVPTLQLGCLMLFFFSSIFHQLYFTNSFTVCDLSSIFMFVHICWKETMAKEQRYRWYTSVFLFLRNTWQDYDRSDYRTSMNVSRSKLASEEKRYIHPHIHTFTLFDHFSTVDLLLTILSVVSLFGCLIFLIPILMFNIIYCHQFQCFYTLLNIFRFCLFSIFVIFGPSLSVWQWLRQSGIMWRGGA